MDPDWLKPNGDAWTLKLHIVPGASQNTICGQHGNALKLKIDAPPVDGKANKALIRYLASRLKCRKNQIILIRGQQSRTKTVEIHDVTPDWITQRLVSKLS